MYVSDRAMPPESSTIAAIEVRFVEKFMARFTFQTWSLLCNCLPQSLLQIPHVGNKTEESFMMDALGEDGLATDPDFPPGPGAMWVLANGQLACACAEKSAHTPI
jgi:hypothetical protein